MTTNVGECATVFEYLIYNLFNRPLSVLLPVVAIATVICGLSAVSRAEPAKLTIVALGDSLTAGFELPPSAAFPVQLERALAAAGQADVQVLNAGVSGDTTAAGLARFEWSVPDNADAVILELGANDALRGVPIEVARENLVKILDKIEHRGIPVLIAGIPAIANWGDDYQRAFAELFDSLAERYGALLYENFLGGLEGDPALSLPDGLHPSEKGVGVIVENIMPKVVELIERARSAKSGRK